MGQSLILVTISSRLIFFPSSIYVQILSHKMAQIRPELQILQNEVRLAYSTGDRMGAQLKHQEIKKF